jgi:hypothetical protein
VVNVPFLPVFTMAWARWHRRSFVALLALLQGVCVGFIARTTSAA